MAVLLRNKVFCFQSRKLVLAITPVDIFNISQSSRIARHHSFAVHASLLSRRLPLTGTWSRLILSRHLIVGKAHISTSTRFLTNETYSGSLPIRKAPLTHNPQNNTNSNIFSESMPENSARAVPVSNDQPLATNLFDSPNQLSSVSNVANDELSRSKVLQVSNTESYENITLPTATSAPVSNEEPITTDLSDASHQLSSLSNVVNDELTNSEVSQVGIFENNQSITLPTADKSSSDDYIPQPPSPPAAPDSIAIAPDSIDIAPTITEHLEQSLVSQGLGGWSPPGMIQHLLDWLHVSVGLPWWVSIAIATFMVRLLVFPLFVKAQRNAAILNNNMPQMQLLQLKITEARQNGNTLEVAKYTNELMVFMKEKNCNPFKSMIAPLAQAPIFISFFIGLREMANLPVESFKSGGMLWFVDLTMPDPYCLLPLITCTTLFITIEIGAEGGVRVDHMQAAKYVMRAIPVIVFPFIMNFSGGILCYWVTSNAITLFQVGLLKIPGVREFLKINKIVKFSPNTLPIKKKGFVESFKDAYTNSKIAGEMQGRTQVDQIRFRKAGMGPVPKTYKFDPTKQRKA